MARFDTPGAANHEPKYSHFFAYTPLFCYSSFFARHRQLFSISKGSGGGLSL
jgi:hypothetical protein